MIYEGMSRTDVERIGKEHATNTDIATVLGSFKLYIDLNEQSIAKHLSQDGFWEAWVTSWLTKVIKPGFVCVDAGANYGYFTRLMEYLTGPKGHVIAIEANPKLTAFLEKSLIDFPMDNGSKVSVINCALADNPGSVELVIEDGNDCNSTIFSAGQEVNTTRVQVVMNSLDILFGTDTFIDVVKLDIEGAEQLALKGMTQLLAAGMIGMIVLEVNTDTVKENPRFIHELFYKYDVSIVAHDGEEYPVSLSYIETSKDSMMLVLRNLKSQF